LNRMRLATFIGLGLQNANGWQDAHCYSWRVEPISAALSGRKGEERSRILRNRGGARAANLSVAALAVVGKFKDGQATFALERK
jgi:hypothetical protein